MAEESSAHVHHLLVYLCTNISNPSAAGTDCDSAPDDVSSCLSSKLFGAWAIGGEVGFLISYMHYIKLS